MYNQLLKYDTNFSEGMFITNIDNMFIQILSSMMHKSIDDIRHFVNDEIFSNLNSRVEYLKNNKYIQFYDELNVKNTEILEVIETENSFQINVKLNARYMDYILDSSAKIIKGQDKSRIEVPYYLTFEKNKVFKELGEARMCQGCGASMNINHSGKCNYCGTIFNLDERNWILISFKSE